MLKMKSTLIALLLTASCGQSPSNSNSELNTVAYREGLWTTSRVKVCWLIESPSTESFRKQLEDVTTTAFEASVIQFSGWQLCGPQERDTVHLFLYDDEDSRDDVHHQEILRYLNAITKGVGPGHPRLLVPPSPRDDAWTVHVVLNQTLKDSIPEFEELAKQLTPQGRNNLAVSTSIHELGHVFGLRHEDIHPGATCDTYYEYAGDETIFIGDYNPFSFMSRCYYRTFNYNLGRLLPNKLDIQGINTLYKDLAH